MSKARSAGSAAGRQWARYEPSTQSPWTLGGASHLWRRAGFGATWKQLQQAVKVGPQATIDRLLKGGADTAAFNRTYDGYAGGVDSVGALRAWWLRRIIETPHPLLEKMTLFWHDFFAVSADGVADAPSMLGHVKILRAGALGRFDALLAAVSRDPATLLSLGADANRKAMPNDRFARQLLDRYTVGEGNYREKDVREVARAMTGQFVLRMRLRSIDREHDDGVKTVLGQTGKFTGADAVRIAATHPATARNIVRRLYRWFISEVDRPDDAMIAPLVKSFAKDFDIARLVETMLRSNLFFSDRAVGRRIKRPVEYAVGIVRGMEAALPTTKLAVDLAALGEDLYRPPTPNGWAGGRHWINPATLVGRSNLAAALLAPKGPYGGKLDPAAVAGRHGHTGAKPAGRFLASLLASPGQADDVFEKLWAAAPQGANPADRLRKFTHTLVTQPEFQLA